MEKNHLKRLKIKHLKEKEVWKFLESFDFHLHGDAKNVAFEIAGLGNYNFKL